MAFWGVELEPGKPYTHSYNSSLGRLRISQATLEGPGICSGCIAVKCKVGNKSPVSLCLMEADVNGSCMLDIELEEKEDDVVFEVIGNRNVHLTGFYLCHNGQSGKAALGNCGGRCSTSQNAHVKTEFNVLEMGGEPEYKDTEVNGRRVRTMASGLVIEDIKRGKKPDIAYHGCYVHLSLSLCLFVEIFYSGQIKRTGYVFESNYGHSQCKSFTLGKGDVIKGLDEGINGMHVGGKRRITIPPSMGYCGAKARSDVPADEWLVFEVDLDDAE
ncbi:hypothetical protein MKW94_012980 [Papaver nudicaule]|uniref:peptidylprolyl isomerase n=1 Tax=Papaver nudicaule TaxID=74823 RepID=A0AA41V3V5_PAPNU|nr:hypothetical protein [Papaver nudicaule]